jgi:hypothetical protein
VPPGVDEPEESDRLCPNIAGASIEMSAMSDAKKTERREEFLMRLLDDEELEFRALRNENKPRKTPWLSRSFFHPRHWGEICL